MWAIIISRWGVKSGICIIIAIDLTRLDLLRRPCFPAHPPVHPEINRLHRSDTATRSTTRHNNLRRNASSSPLLHYYPHLMPKNPYYTTPTPWIPILPEFWEKPPKSERDFCIQTPIFRWTPLPTAIPSRRNFLIFSRFLAKINPHYP